MLKNWGADHWEGTMRWSRGGVGSDSSPQKIQISEIKIVKLSKTGLRPPFSLWENFLDLRMGTCLTAGNDVVPSATICWHPAGHCALKCKNKILQTDAVLGCNFFWIDLKSSVIFTVSLALHMQLCLTWLVLSENSSEIPVFAWFLHVKFKHGGYCSKFNWYKIVTIRI